MNMTEQFVVQIVEDATGKVVRQTKPVSERRAERMEDGMMINLNHASYSTRILPESEAVPESEIG